MKTAVSLPDALFEEAESLATRLGLSRSGLYAAAIEDFVSRHRAKRVSEKLDAVYGDQSSGLDPSVLAAQRKVLKRSDW
jgi:metal-responsive CopG/Arc/MetJ family transcriptional regulator